MESIRLQSGYLFLLKVKELADTKVSANIKNASLDDVMSILLADYSLDWILRGRTIVVSKHPSEKPRNFIPLPIAGKEAIQQDQVSGRVVDESHNPVEGVTVTIKGASDATTSNADGDYQLTVEGVHSVLVFTAIGFQPREVRVAGQRVINVTLLASVRDPDEVVVIGYGTQRRSEVTGAIASISPEETTEKHNYNN